MGQALSDYDAEIGVQMQQLQNYLVSKDNYTKPKWCKDPGHYGGSEVAFGTASALAASQDLPSCPALPPVPPSRARSEAPQYDDDADTKPRSPLPVPPVPGLLAAAGDLGSLFGRGYDPLEQSARGAVAEWPVSPALGAGGATLVAALG